MPGISIVVPTYDNGAQLRHLLCSLEQSTYDDFEVIVADHPLTRDETPAVVAEFRGRGMPIVRIVDNVTMSHARNVGTGLARADVILHLDADMRVPPDLLGECLDRIGRGADALVLPETGASSTFWLRCKALEKACYEGTEIFESLRCVRRAVSDSIGGLDERIVFGGDKDFDLRVRGAGARVERTRAYVCHDEGEASLRGVLRKKLLYGQTAARYARLHPRVFARQMNPFLRLRLIFRRRDLMRHEPLLYWAIFVLGAVEIVGGALGIVRSALRRRPTRRASADANRLGRDLSAAGRI
jgi:glycosyltransferase involved in cell wall biosynthesis